MQYWKSLYRRWVWGKSEYSCMKITQRDANWMVTHTCSLDKSANSFKHHKARRRLIILTQSSVANAAGEPVMGCRTNLSRFIIVTRPCTQTADDVTRNRFMRLRMSRKTVFGSAYGISPISTSKLSGVRSAPRMGVRLIKQNKSQAKHDLIW